ncbi:pimelyl-ACP methyl ester esterase BioV [Sulfurimonas sp. SAG-AH-194-I05]|nr:pimelyl-ACP methyl ester esterase BioV [Sulfurimonas sp. SAG-AH-194-I05]MDF1876163.1 pimelyl-ACP methyl ester esterase BioV [Sulfurimonas sp. SAG-AH-194-I05]
MQFHSGFSLKNEEYFFKEYIKYTDYTICGFSYGAIKAFEEVQKHLACGKRIDTLQLFSPAFFQNTSTKFHRLQILSYVKNSQKYVTQFLEGCFAPHAKQETQASVSTKEELVELLEYKWDIDQFLALEEKGVKIEVYLGAQDKIINASVAKDFFLNVATVTYIKEANHFLQLQ